MDRGDWEEGGEELRNDLEEMLFDGAGIGKSNFFAANRGPGASGDRGTGLQYQSYGERGGWTEYAYPDDEFVPVSGEEENYVLEAGGDFTAGSESDELNEVEYGDVADRRISVDGERSTHSSFEDLRTTAVPYSYKTTIKYKTTVNDSFNYIRLENDPKATATTTKTTVTTTTTATYSTSTTTVRYIENGKEVNWPRVPTSSFIDDPEHENEISEGTTPRATAADVAAEEREWADADGEENTIGQREISPKPTASSVTPESTSTGNFLMPEIRVTYVPPDKRQVGGDGDGGGAKDTTEKVLTGGVLFGGGSGGGAEKNAAVRFSHLSTVMLISPLVLTFLNVEFVLNHCHTC